ncbi:hypothetical protein INT48_008735 [Thamnidium elegans]|uniref:Uncharacterized protein n=1 Tax=Thamnidium elegans TaxID=101142 RepID=A0A8H7SGA2_9FUNG|nr:hypothetical protein INT48_008735 [Thamnidium elegans]
MASSVSLPLAVWHNFTNPNTTCLTSSYPNVYAGQKDGHIWVYTVSDQTLLQHKFLLVGHKTAVVALCVVKTETDALSKSEDVLISASEDGEIIRWNASDGRCQAVNPNGFYGIPRLLKVFSEFSDKHIFCCGQANEITILNSTTLEVVRVWGGHSNWVTCMDFYDPDTNRSRLLTVTIDGRLDIWDFDATKHIIYKDQSAPNRPLILNNTTSFDSAFNLIGNKEMSGICMTLTSKNIMILAMQLAEFVPQFMIPAEPDTSWAGGQFFGKDRFVIWTMNGEVFDYVLHSPESVKTEAIAEGDGRLFYSATLVRSYNLDNNRSIYSGIAITTIICKPGQQKDQLSAVVLCNNPEASGFTILPLQVSDPVQENEPLTYSIETTFRDVWPLVEKCDPEFGNITITAPVNTNHLAIGYDSGTICVVPLSLALLHLTEISKFIEKRDDVRLFEKAHQSAITCMVVPEHHISGQQYLLSGGQDGAVKIWNLIDGKYVASCAVHSMPVEAFIEPAEQKDTRVRGCVVSIAKDNSIALISVDSMTCLFIFPGNPFPLTTIQWRTTEDYLVFGYNDDSVFVWQMQTAHLDRVLHGKNARDVLEDDRWPINRVSSSTTQKPGGSISKQTVSIRSIMSNDNALHTSKSFAQVFTFNIRRLVHELYTRVSQISQEGDQLVLKPSMSSSSFDAVVPDILTFRPDKDDPLDLSGDQNVSLREEMSNKTNAKKFEEIREKRMELITAVVSTIASWDISEAFEEVCCKSLRLSKGISPNISYGLKGANGNLSILAPLKNERVAWTISPSMTATRLLSIALLAKAIIFMAGQESRSSDLISGYAMSLPLVIGKDYCFPSLSLLSKYWQDTSARSLFSSAVTGLSPDDIVALVDYWEAFLPTSNLPENSGPQMMARASIVLGIMGCDQPQTLSSRVRKSTALSLTILLSDAELDESRHASDGEQMLSAGSMARTLSSMELLSQGFQTWETFINAAEVLRTLFMYATDPLPAMALVSRGAKTAIFQISVANMPLVISTLTFDTMNAKSLDDRLRCLKIIGSFIRKEPILLNSNVYSVVEAVVKTLDPNVPHMREVMLNSATSILHDLVKTYPSVDFSGSAQKLAVGTLEGASVIYDVRTATRSVVLEGHVGPVSVLAFSPDAKLIATCSLIDQSVRVWYTNLSLFGMLTSSLSHGLGSQSNNKMTTSNSSTTSSHNPSGSQKPHKVFSFAMPDDPLDPTETIKKVRFEWMSSKCVKLHVKDLVMSFNV